MFFRADIIRVAVGTSRKNSRWYHARSSEAHRLSSPDRIAHNAGCRSRSSYREIDGTARLQQADTRANDSDP